MTYPLFRVSCVKAVAEMNGHILGNKPLYVALAQRKDERKVTTHPGSPSPPQAASLSPSWL